MCKIKKAITVIYKDKQLKQSNKYKHLKFFFDKFVNRKNGFYYKIPFCVETSMEIVLLDFCVLVPSLLVLLSKTSVRTIEVREHSLSGRLP